MISEERFLVVLNPSGFCESLAALFRFLSGSSGETGETERLPVKSVVIHRQVLDSILSYSKMAFPREGILLLRGKTKKGVVEVDSVVIPPNAVHGQGFSGFNWWMIPIDLSYVGVAHSHPSGHAVPSHQDLLHITGILGLDESGVSLLYQAAVRWAEQSFEEVSAVA